MRRLVVAFDMDDTLVTTDGRNLWLRPGARSLLAWLRPRGHEVRLWTSASRAWTAKVLAAYPDLARSFSRVDTREATGSVLKDAIRAGVDLLVDDLPAHRDFAVYARGPGVAGRYLILGGYRASSRGHPVETEPRWADRVVDEILRREGLASTAA